MSFSQLVIIAGRRPRKDRGLSVGIQPLPAAQRIELCLCILHLGLFLNYEHPQGPKSVSQHRKAVCEIGLF